MSLTRRARASYSTRNLHLYPQSKSAQRWLPRAITLTVTMSATDAGGIRQVTANGVALTPGTPPLWTSRIPVSGPNGVKKVTVAVSDHAGNSTNAQAAYKVTRVLGTNFRCFNDVIMSWASWSYLFKLWGKVTIIDAANFWLDDGITKVKVIAPGYTGIADGNLASARGILDTMGYPVTLTCPAELVVKEH